MEKRQIVYTAFDDDFSYSNKGKFAGVVKGAYQTYATYYVKGDDSHEYLYVDSCFYKKLPLGTNDDGSE